MAAIRVRLVTRGTMPRKNPFQPLFWELNLSYYFMLLYPLGISFFVHLKARVTKGSGRVRSAFVFTKKNMQEKTLNGH